MEPRDKSGMTERDVLLVSEWKEDQLAHKAGVEWILNDDVDEELELRAACECDGVEHLDTRAGEPSAAYQRASTEVPAVPTIRTAVPPGPCLSDGVYDYFADLDRETRVLHDSETALRGQG